MPPVFVSFFAAFWFFGGEVRERTDKSMDVMALLSSSFSLPSHGCRTKKVEEGSSMSVRRISAGGALRTLLQAPPGLRCPSNRTSVPYLPHHMLRQRFAGSRERGGKGLMRPEHLPKRVAKRSLRRDLRHRGVHLDRNLVLADLDEYGSGGRPGFRMSRMLQILHDPPSLPAG